MSADAAPVPARLPPLYLDGANCVLYDYGERVDLLLGFSGEMQLPVNRGQKVALELADKIASACGYLASTTVGGDLYCEVHDEEFVLAWGEGPQAHLLKYVYNMTRGRTVAFRERAPELWERLEQSRGEV